MSLKLSRVVGGKMNERACNSQCKGWTRPVIEIENTRVPSVSVFHQTTGNIDVISLSLTKRRG